MFQTRVQFEVSDIGFEMQDSFDFEFVQLFPPLYFTKIDSGIIAETT
jgi:hypothetical protein